MSRQATIELGLLGAGTSLQTAGVAGWTPDARRSQEFPFYPARVVMQDFTGVPAAVDETRIYEAAVHYQRERVPLLVIAGKEYRSGSSRDWAAKTVRATREDGSQHSFGVTVRIDTPIEIDYYQHGGILPYVMRSLITHSRGRTS